MESEKPNKKPKLTDTEHILGVVEHGYVGKMGKDGQKEKNFPFKTSKLCKYNLWHCEYN